jgi:putative ABC transport system permease protein
MIKNYLKITFRSMARSKVYTVVNLFGLSTGMAVSMLIGLWIFDELTFNTSLPNYSRIAEMMRDFSYNGTRVAYGGGPYEMDAELRTKYKSDFSHIVLATFSDNHALVVNGKNIRVIGRYMGEEVVQMLSLQLLEGNPKGLHDPSSIFLSASTAKALFGNVSPLGKMLTVDSSRLLHVTGVYEDLPYNSEFKDLGFIAPLQLYVSMRLAQKQLANPWRFLNLFYVYVQLADGANWNTVNEKIKYLRRDKMDAQTWNADKIVQFLYPMSRWHLYNAEQTSGSRDKMQYVWLLGLIGVFVLLLACINFMNLSTARSEKRAKEVGIRKTIGSLRGQIILQFFSESMFAVGCSLVFCLIWTLLLLPVFNNLADKQLSILWLNPRFWLCFLVFGILTGIIAGFYPALYLSSFRPIQVLKGTFKAGPEASIPRKALVVLQFTISIALIIGTLIVYRQIRYAQQRPVGYDKTDLVMIARTPSIENHFQSFRQDLRTEGVASDAALAVNTPTDFNADDFQFNWKDKDPNSTPYIVIGNVTTEYGRTIGWQIKEGRDFSTSMLTDSSAFILNESAVQLMGFRHPIGQTVEWRGKLYHVIGVIRNILFESPYQSSSPSIFHISGGQRNWAVVLRVNPSLSMSTAVARIKDIYSRYDPIYPIEYRFVDQEYAKKFGDEVRIGRLSLLFTIFAVIISCLGLLGMVSFMAEQRRREIGIRKVLGASVLGLWQLLAKEFLLLLIIALFIASPLAWYCMNKWLQQFQYRTTVVWWVFALAGAGAMLITLVTVSFQSIKAALMNPVKSLRAE